MSGEKHDGDKIIAPNDDKRLKKGRCSGPSSAARERDLKKGLWSSSEDAILLEYIREHGQGNWDNVQKITGLRRSGKSCRLRWTNMLRPDLIRGSFNPEEERKIAYLHSKMGNQWARIATFFPGHTDNDIKNFWNARIKRRKSAYLPLYSPSELNYSVPGFTPDNSMYQCRDNRARKVLHGSASHSPQFPDFSSTGLASQGLGSHTHYGFNAGMNRPMQSMEFQNRHNMDVIGQRMFNQVPPDPRSLIPPNYYSPSMPFVGTVQVELPSIQHPATESGGWTTFPPPPPFETIHPPPYEVIHPRIRSHTHYGFNAGMNRPMQSMEFQNRHNMVIGQRMFNQVPPDPRSHIGPNYNSPSLQHPATDSCDWANFPPPPPYETIHPPPYEVIHPHIRPPAVVSSQPHFAPPSSRLPETFVQGSHAMSPAWEQLAISPNNVPETLIADISAANWEWLTDPIPHFCQSTVSLFGECVPTSNSSTGFELIEPSAEQIPTQNVDGPGALFGSGSNIGASREPQ